MTHLAWWIQRSALGGAVLAACFVTASAFSATQTRSAVMQVAPVRVEFAPEQPAQSLVVFNPASYELQAQVRVMRWTQSNDQDVLVPAVDVVASPAIMTVPPGQRQTVRLVRLQPSVPQQELSYRVIVNELPHTAPLQESGLNILLAHSIPVFVKTSSPSVLPNGNSTKPAATDLSSVQARIVPGKDGRADLHVRNNGARALRIANLQAQTSDGSSRVVDQGLLGYVLPGQQMSWPVQLPYPSPPGLTLKARFNDDTDMQTVPLEGVRR